jgi:hypothetical protein
VRHILERGERTRPLDLRGRDRAIGSIEMAYRALPNRGIASPRFAWKVVSLTQQCPHPVPGAGNWVELGCQQVSLFGKDRDSCGSAGAKGRFKAIRLHARGADVELINVRVIYSQWTTRRSADAAYPQARRAHATHGPEGLGACHRPGRHAVYRTVPNFKGLATVCVEG